jgi:hypothetical protein
MFTAEEPGIKHDINCQIDDETRCNCPSLNAKTIRVANCSIE